MPTPSKPLALLRKHVSKADKERRSRAEKELVTGETMRSTDQVRSDKVAFAHWRRIYALLAKIGKNDALLENVLNRYCMLLSECAKAETELEIYRGMLQEIITRKDEIGFLDFANKVREMGTLIQACDKQLTTKRKMLLDIEDKNILTVASQLRSIPKKAPKGAPDEMEAFLQQRGAHG